MRHPRVNDANGHAHATWTGISPAKLCFLRTGSRGYTHVESQRDRQTMGCRTAALSSRRTPRDGGMARLKQTENRLHTALGNCCVKVTTRTPADATHSWVNGWIIRGKNRLHSNRNLSRAYTISQRPQMAASPSVSSKANEFRTPKRSLKSRRRPFRLSDGISQRTQNVGSKRGLGRHRTPQ